MKNNRINVAFLAFLAWMAALLMVALLSSCGSQSQYTYSYDGRVVKQHNMSPCSAYN